jgi:uncharacterized protein (TIGR02453 family)
MISAQTIQFLTSLKDNNNRPWFEAHKVGYKAAQSEITDLIKVWIHGFSATEPAVALLDPKKCIFRIYRDVRFSKNKLPYKTNLGAFLSIEGKSTAKAGYYFHLEPGNSFFAAGLYLPDNQVLAKVRQEIDYNLDEFLGILSQPAFKLQFPSLDEEHKLKKPPKGYDKTHPAIELLKLKSFIVWRPLKEEEILSANLGNQLATLSATVFPFNAFLNRAME